MNLLRIFGVLAVAALLVGAAGASSGDVVGESVTPNDDIHATLWHT